MNDKPLLRWDGNASKSSIAVEGRTGDSAPRECWRVVRGSNSAACADPYPAYARLRAEAPIHRTPDGLWILTRHANVASVLRDPRFGREGFERHFAPEHGVGAGGSRQSMLFRDPPHHTRLREVVHGAFTPRAGDALRPRIQAHVDALLDCVAPARRIDVVADLAEPLPRAIVGTLLGIPEADWTACATWSAAIARSLDALPIPEDEPLVAEGRAARRALGGYLRELVAARRTEPGADLLTAFVEAADQHGLLSESELVALAVLLLVAGIETTGSLIGTTVWALLHHPSEWARLREAPWRLPAAVEETLRWESPIQRTWRIATTDVELDGHRIPAGALVVLCLGAANRDPARFADPDRFDVERRDLGHLAFGAGVHACLGAVLGRVETLVAVGTLLRRWPTLQLVTERPAWRPTATLRTLATLPVTW
jgi:pimeloyl-[acyl-carrier protein] synthase